MLHIKKLLLAWVHMAGNRDSSSAQDVVFFFFTWTSQSSASKMLPLSIVENKQKLKAKSPFYKIILENKLNKTPEVTSESDESGVLLLGYVLFCFAHWRGDMLLVRRLEFSILWINLGQRRRARAASLCGALCYRAAVPGPQKLVEISQVWLK